SERAFLETVSEFAYCNPFLPEHTRLEHDALGKEFMEGEPVWSMTGDPDQPRANVWRIYEKTRAIVAELRRRLIAAKAPPREADLLLYEDAVLHMLYQSYYRRFYDASFGDQARFHATRWRFFHEFRSDWSKHFEIEGITMPS